MRRIFLLRTAGVLGASFTVASGALQVTLAPLSGLLLGVGGLGLGSGVVTGGVVALLSGGGSNESREEEGGGGDEGVAESGHGCF